MFLLQQVEATEAGCVSYAIPIRHFTVFILDSEVQDIFLGFVAVKKKNGKRRE